MSERSRAKDSRDKKRKKKHSRHKSRDSDERKDKDWRKKKEKRSKRSHSRSNESDSERRKVLHPEHRRSDPREPEPEKNDFKIGANLSSVGANDVPVDTELTLANYQKAYGLKIGNYSLLSTIVSTTTSRNNAGQQKKPRARGKPYTEEEKKRRWTCPKCGKSNYQTEYECTGCKRLRAHF